MTAERATNGKAIEGAKLKEQQTGGEENGGETA